MTSLQDKIQSKLQTNNKKMLQEIDEIIATFKSFIMKSVHDIVIIIGKISARLTTHNSPSIGCSSGTNISKKSPHVPVVYQRYLSYDKYIYPGYHNIEHPPPLHFIIRSYLTPSSRN